MIQVIGAAAAYLVVHLALYVLVFRNVRAFTNESVIFLYHLLSAVVVSVAAVIAALIPGSGVDWTTAVAIVSLHGVYSISFLEVWSLAEGSYSLQIMSYLQRLEQRGGTLDVAALQDIGTAKQANRTDGLIKLGLLGHHEGQLRLTGLGRIVAGLLAAIAWLANVSDEG
jgi:hypothetical protein